MTASRAPQRLEYEDYVSLLIDHLRPTLKATRKISENDALRERLIRDIRAYLNELKP